MTLGGSTALQDTRVYAQDTKPQDQRDGIIWVDTSDPSRTTYVFSTSSGKFEKVAPPQPITVTEQALSFRESDLTLTRSNASIISGSVHPAGTDSVSRTGDDSTYSTGKQRGVLFNPNTNIVEITGYTSANTSGATTMYLEDHSDGTRLGTESISSGQATFTGLDLRSGKDYRLFTDAGGSTYDSGYYSGSVSASGAHLDITNGCNGSGNTYSSPYSIGSIDSVGGKGGSTGSVTVEFPTKEIYGWDLATFQRTESGGTCTVDIERYDGSSWVTEASDVTRNYDLGAIPASDPVRLAATFDRTGSGDISLDYGGVRYER